MIEKFESRTFFSSSAVVAYLPDYEYASTINKIDWAALTQINYFSLSPSGTTGKLPTRSTGGVALAKLISTVSKAQSHGVKVDIVIGGAGFDASLPVIAADATLRNAFADSAKAFCTKYHIAGVDLDWEPENPSASGISHYGAFIHTLHLRAPKLTISAAVNSEKLPVAGTNTTSFVLNAQALKNLTSINVMAYDLSFADHSTYAQSTQDLTAWGKYVVANGVSKKKLLLGMPFYGRAGTSWNNTAAEGYGALVDASILQDGIVAVNSNEIDASFSDAFGGAREAWHFNGPTTIAKKTKFAINGGYGGVMVWNLGQDHYSVGHTDRFSLLPVIASVVKKASV